MNLFLNQLRAIVQMKRRMLVHALTPGRMVGAALLGMMTVGAALLSLALGVGLFFLGTAMGGEDSWNLFLVLCMLTGIFFMVWAMGLLMEVQRSDVLDFRKFLHFPISLPGLFSLNFAASCVSLSMPFFFIGVTGLALGLAAERGPHFLLGLVHGVLFFAMLAAWAYYARTLVALLLANKRRRRLVLTLLPLGFVLIGQVPSLLRPSIESGYFSEDTVEMVLKGIVYGVPICWLPLGWSALLEGDHGTAVWTAIALGGCCLVGLILSYRSTRRFYQGGGTGTLFRKSAGTRETVPKSAAKPAATLRPIPLLGEPLAALLRAFAINIRRHPHIRMLLISPAISALLILSIYNNSFAKMADSPQVAHWMPLGITCWCLFCFFVIMLNVFGLDPTAFRALVLFPAPRRHYLLAANVALAPMALGSAWLFIALAGAVMGVSPRMAALWIPLPLHLYLLMCLVGNAVSIYFPYPMGFDARRQQNRWAIALMNLVSMPVVSALTLPSVLCLWLDGRYLSQPAGAFPWGIACAWILLGISLLTYAVLWPLQGDWLFTREQRMLEKLRREGADA
jgi:ABC-2 type transport system permease protein